MRVLALSLLRLKHRRMSNNLHLYLSTVGDTWPVVEAERDGGLKAGLTRSRQR